MKKIKIKLSKTVVTRATQEEIDAGKGDTEELVTVLETELETEGGMVPDVAIFDGKAYALIDFRHASFGDYELTSSINIPGDEPGKIITA